MPTSMIAFQDALATVLEEYKQLWLERSRLAQETASLRAELSMRTDSIPDDMPEQESDSHLKLESIELTKDEAECEVPEEGFRESSWKENGSLGSSIATLPIDNKLRLWTDRVDIPRPADQLRKAEQARKAEALFAENLHVEKVQSNESNLFGGSFMAGPMARQMEAIRRARSGEPANLKAVKRMSSDKLPVDRNASSSWTMLKSAESHVSSATAGAESRRGSTESLREKGVRIISPPREGTQSKDLMSRAVISLITHGKTLKFCHLKLLESANVKGVIPIAAIVAFLEAAIRDEDEPDFVVTPEKFEQDVACHLDLTSDGAAYVDSFYGMLQKAWRTDWTEKRLASTSVTYNSGRLTAIRGTLTPAGQPSARHSSRRHVDLESYDFGTNSHTLGIRASSTSAISHASFASSRAPAAPGNTIGWIRSSSSNFIPADSVSPIFSGSHAPEGRLFPQWWNPPKVGITAGSESKYSQSITLRAMQEEDKTEDRCVLSPVSSYRLSWDAIAFFFVLYEVWASPFELVFLTPEVVPSRMRTLALVMFVFFAIDICLNFNTGYVQGYTIVLRRRMAAKHYLVHWFLVDLVATVPFDRLTEEASSSFFSSLRYVKMLKAMKIIRYIRLNKVIDTLKNTQRSYEFIRATEWIYRSFAGIMGMLLITHLNCCIWAAVDPDKQLGGAVNEALDSYLYSFQETFIVFFSASPLGATTVTAKLVEMLICTERAMILIGAFSFGVFKAMMIFEEDAHRSVRKDDTLRYLRRHNVPVKTQLQVVFALKQAARAKGEQNNFNSFLEHELPEELRRVIAEELWSIRLLTLGLIEAVAKWHVDFLPELALICREEVLASGATVFRQGESCLGAYQVITGLVAIRNNQGDKIPNFREGMWIGEKALVNPRFRRSATGHTLTMCYLMLVPAEGFQALLLHLELNDVFETWCAAELWLGLCGRCGTLGDHFTDACPHEQETAKVHPTKILSRNTAQMRRSMKVLASSAQTTRASDVSTGDTKASGNLQKYLHFHAIEHLAKALDCFEVRTLEDLEECDKSQLRAWMLENMPDTPMTASDMASLSAKQISRFRDEVQVQIQRMLDMRRPEHQQHLIFLSHYKLEAGTEAALMRSELEALIAEDEAHPANCFTSPVFLDSEDLQDLKDLQQQVTNSHNVGLLCTAGVLNRPWVLVEIATASEMKVPIIPVQVDKRGNTFQFPDNAYYSGLRGGTLLGAEGHEVLENCKVDLEKLVVAIRSVFNRIAVSYSPHKSATIRRAELQTLLEQCQVRQDES